MTHRRSKLLRHTSIHSGWRVRLSDARVGRALVARARDRASPLASQCLGRAARTCGRATRRLTPGATCALDGAAQCTACGSGIVSASCKLCQVVFGRRTAVTRVTRPPIAARTYYINSALRFPPFSHAHPTSPSYRKSKRAAADCCAKLLPTAPQAS